MFDNVGRKHAPPTPGQFTDRINCSAPEFLPGIFGPWFTDFVRNYFKPGISELPTSIPPGGTKVQDRVTAPKAHSVKYFYVLSEIPRGTSKALRTKRGKDII